MKSFPAEEMDAVARPFPGRIGVCIKDLNTGLRYEYNADEPLPTASVVKVSIMIELFRQAHDGELSLDDRHRMRTDISSHGTGTLSIMRDYPELTLRDYCRLMMGVSDNMATDMIVHLLTPECDQRDAGRDGLPQHSRQHATWRMALPDEGGRRYAFKGTRRGHTIG